MNAATVEMVMGFIDDIPTMVKGDKQYIRMLIDQATKRMPPPQTKEEEDKANADEDKRQKALFDHMKEQEERRTDIAVKEAEAVQQRIEGMAKTAKENAANAKKGVVAESPVLPNNPTLSGTQVSKDASNIEAEEAAGKSSKQRASRE